MLSSPSIPEEQSPGLLLCAVFAPVAGVLPHHLLGMIYLEPPTVKECAY